MDELVTFFNLFFMLLLSHKKHKGSILYLLIKDTDTNFIVIKEAFADLCLFLILIFLKTILPFLLTVITCTKHV